MELKNSEEKYMVVSCRSCFNNKKISKIKVRKFYDKVVIVCFTCQQMVCSFSINKEDLPSCECCQAIQPERRIEL